MINLFENMGNKVCLVTGASSGLGNAVAKIMATRGAKVVMISRDKPRGKRAYEEIRNIPESNVEWIPTDLSSLESIRKLVETFQSKYSKLDILFNCGAEQILSKFETVDNLDKLFVTNYLGHFLLANLLFESLKQAAPSKVITISGSGHKPKFWEGPIKSKIDFNDLQGNKHFSAAKHGKQVVLAKIMFTYELARKWEAYNIAATTLCPGLTHTNQGDAFPKLIQMLIPLQYMLRGAQLPEEGGKHLIDLALKRNNEVNGKYFEGSKKGLFEAKSSEESYNITDAKKLWDESEKLICQQFTY
jgi:NAD(P)-dependent dehydrogenase (short-subunit alcohol dehydrogenase family)